MAQNKGFLISIIALLAISSGLFIGGLYLKKDVKPVEKEIKKEEVKENNEVTKISIYDEDNVYVGEYVCNNLVCDFATSIIDDAKYGLDYYSEEVSLKLDNLINHRYVFINDTNTDNEAEAILYDVVKKEAVGKYQAVKNYGIGIENDIFFVKDENNYWGIIKLDSDTVTKLIPFSYDYIGLLNEVDTDANILVADRYAALSGTNWYILDNMGSTLSTAVTEAIKSYTGLYIITFINNQYKIYDYSGNQIEPDNEYIHIKTTGKYIEFVTNKNKLFIYDGENHIQIGETINLPSANFNSDALYPPYETKLAESSIVIKIYTDQTYGTNRTITYAT